MFKRHLMWMSILLIVCLITACNSDCPKEETLEARDEMVRIGDSVASVIARKYDLPRSGSDSALSLLNNQLTEVEELDVPACAQDAKAALSDSLQSYITGLEFEYDGNESASIESYEDSLYYLEKWSSEVDKLEARFSQ
jgi:hypothetical protein